MKKCFATICAFLAIGLSASISRADLVDISVDISNVNFNALENDLSNVNLPVNLGAGFTQYDIVGIGWDVELEAFAPSWLSEAVIRFDDSSNAPQLYLTVGIADDNPGVGSYSSGGVLDLVGLNLDWSQTGSSLNLHFFDSFDDGFSPQATVGNGTLVVRVNRVPEPSSVALLGLTAVGLLVRRRR